MAIIKNVGKDANNDKADAKLVQAALNLSQSSKFKLKKILWWMVMQVQKQF